MGCGDSKTATVHVLSEDTKLGSEGSSEEFGGSDEEMFIQRRTWGSPAPPLPDIAGSRADKRSRRSESMEIIHKNKGGAAFVIQEEAARINNPPRRLQKLSGAKTMTLEDLTRKQREHERNREKRLQEKKENLSRQHSKKKNKASLEFENAQQVFVKSETRLNRVSKNREGFVHERVMRVREHNKKVVDRKRLLQSLSVRDEELNMSGKIEHDMEYNKSESESWADNDSIKNIYDQMDYITPASGASAVNHNNNMNNASDDEFFS
ncbi:uncharacterized protein LOC134818479 isoform X3 [Bolinopsis microptera]|uniref:uncharacterized protein LOC134818479 isoform X3 n=1 Tax=Bolinopsis microptera TaxID=2820187 RepID=UPI003079E225